MWKWYKEYPSVLEAAVLTLKEQPQWHRSTCLRRPLVGPGERRAVGLRYKT